MGLNKRSRTAWISCCSAPYPPIPLYDMIFGDFKLLFRMIIDIDSRGTPVDQLGFVITYWSRNIKAKEKQHWAEVKFLLSIRWHQPISGRFQCATMSGIFPELVLFFRFEGSHDICVLNNTKLASPHYLPCLNTTTRFVMPTAKNAPKWHSIVPRANLRFFNCNSFGPYKFFVISIVNTSKRIQCLHLFFAFMLQPPYGSQFLGNSCHTSAAATWRDRPKLFL